jgi:histidinol-phosphate aminotransferase
MSAINKLVRKNILELKAYSSARDEFSGTADVYLDANENPYPSDFNRYPDPHQRKLKEKLAKIKNVNSNQIFLGNGSDEAIDLLIRIFCEPGNDSILITEPTYGMYAVCAGVNNVKVNTITLTENFELDADKVSVAIQPTTKIIFLCSPNNPSGNLLNKYAIEKILQQFNGIIVVDEAYIDFAKDEGFVSVLNQYSNLVILQTFSKAWGLAGLRLGMAFASSEIITLMNKVKYPYNVNVLTQKIALSALDNLENKESWITEIVAERERVKNEILPIKGVQKVYPSDANFLLVKIVQANQVYHALLDRGIIVRDRSNVILCNDCLRITIGTPEENNQLLNALRNL